MRPPSFKTRLWLGQVVVLAAMLARAALGADWALRRVVFGEIIDDAILSLASTEAAALQGDPTHPREGRGHRGSGGSRHHGLRRGTRRLRGGRSPALPAFLSRQSFTRDGLSRGSASGLAISRALIERQGGRISVEASGEKGATFTVHLPRA